MLSVVVVVVVVVEVLSRLIARALSACSDSRVDGIPIRVLSIGDTFRLLRGRAPFVVLSVTVVVVLALGGVVVVVVVVELGGVVVVAELSVCWLCVGVGAGAPVPSCVESVVGVAVVDGVVVVVLEDDDESVVVEDDGVGVVVVVPIDESVVVVDEDGVDIVEESVVVEEDGVVVVVDEDGVVIDDESVVVVVDGDEVTSPVDVACEPSFDTRM